jgi:hypothetical protein
MAAELISFTQAIAQADGKKRLLLGNGFSQSCRKNIFSYGSLFNKADFSSLSGNAKKAFDALKTTNFEEVIKALRDSAKLTKVYAASNKSLADKMKSDSEGLKKILVDTIAKNHPLQPNEISNEEFTECRSFLKNFDTIYTLNYDLLLYWTLMHVTGFEDKKDLIKCDDGFRHPDSADDETEYVSWEIENSNDQNIHYLHGALHLFESEVELMKYTWSRTGTKLMDKINAALKKDFYPVIVAEGTSDQKMSRIMKSAYLQRGLKSLASTTGSLFVFGMALHENDEHILKRIRKGKVSELYVGIYGDPESAANKALKKNAQKLSAERSSKKPLDVKFYDASTANVWK